MKTCLPLALVGLAISFAVPPSMAQDAMKVIKLDELVWKEHPFLKGCQTFYIRGDPTKAEPIVRVDKIPPHYRIPPHTHPYTEVVTVLRGTYWNAMGDDMEKGVMLKPGSSFVLPANHIHRTWTTDEETITQATFIGPASITYVNPAEDPRMQAQQKDAQQPAATPSPTASPGTQ
jgi:quercetin dioxygenase-like cupin family protein